MHNKRIIVGLVLLISACSMLEKQIKMPTVELNSVKVAAMSLVDTRLDFHFNIVNPNYFGLSVRKLSYQLSFADHQVLTGTTQKGIKIPAQGKGKMTVPLTINYDSVINTVKMLKNKRNIPYEISGKIDFGLISVPFRKTATLVLPKLPSIKVVGIKVTKITFTDIGLQLQLDLKNANNFPLNFNGVNYQLKIANQALLKGTTVQKMSIAPGGKSRVNVDMKVSLASLGGLIKKFRKGGSLPVSFSGQLGLPNSGSAKSFPVNWQGNVPLWR